MLGKGQVYLDSWGLRRKLFMHEEARILLFFITIFYVVFAYASYVAPAASSISVYQRSSVFISVHQCSSAFISVHPLLFCLGRLVIYTF